MVGGIKTGTYSGKLTWLTWCQGTARSKTQDVAANVLRELKLQYIPASVLNAQFRVIAQIRCFCLAVQVTGSIVDQLALLRSPACSVKHQWRIAQKIRETSRETSTAAVDESWSPRSGFKNSVWRQCVSGSWLKGGLRSTMIRSLKLGLWHPQYWLSLRLYYLFTG